LGYVEGGGALTKTTNGEVQQRPKTFPGYVSETCCWLPTWC